MLSKTSVHRIANELLNQARTRTFGFTDPAGVPVAPFYQCPDLVRLPQGLQLEIVRKATGEVGFSPMFLLAVVAWIIALAVAYAQEPTVLGLRLVPSAFMIVAPLAPLLFRALLIRRAVRLIAQEIAASWPVAVRL